MSRQDSDGGPRDTMPGGHEAPTGTTVEWEGVVLENRYRITRLIGSGGMAHVYEAEQIDLKRVIAVKLMRAALMGDEEHQRRFRTEAMAASRVNHPHAVAVFDLGLTVEGVPYIVMERVRGRSLRAVLSSQGRFTPQRAVTVGAQVLSALEEAHACGVVHCDLKSDNIVLDKVRGEDFAKVVDFGVARLIGQAADRNVVGTPEYIAPELLTGSTPSPRSDVYAAGIVLYEMIAGKTPFAGGSVREVLDRQLARRPVPLDEAVPGCPPSLSAVVQTALEKSPAARFGTAGELREKLLAALELDGQARRCRGCGSPHGARERFCMTCGAAVRSPAAIAASAGPNIARGTVPPPEVEDDDRNLPTRSTCHVRPSGAGTLVGRARELAEIGLFMRGEHNDSVLGIVGPSGAGKASIVLEAARAAAPAIVTFVTGPDPSGLAHPWYPILALLEAMLGIPAPPSYEDIRAALPRCRLPDRDAPGLAEIFGVTGPLAEAELAVRRREANAAARRAILAGAMRYPSCVICLMDVGSWDGPSRRLVAALTELPPDARPRIIVTADDAAHLARGRMIELGPLEPEAVAELLLGLAGPRPVEVRDAAVERSGGWPLMIEQLAAWLDEGRGLDAAPPELVEVIAARLSHLPTTPRMLLQAIAIWGQAAYRSDVMTMLADRKSLTAALALLVRSGFVVVQGRELVIPSSIVRDAVLASTPPDVRRHLSGWALKLLPPGRSPALAAALAEEAGDEILAARMSVAAGDDGVRRFDDSGAASWFARGRRVARRALLGGGEEALDWYVTSSVRLADVLRFIEEPQVALACLDEVEQVHELERRHRAAVARARGRVAISAGKPDDAIAELQTALGLGLATGDVELVCEAYVDLASAHARSGGTRAAIIELVDAMELLSPRRPQPRSLWRIAMLLAQMHIFEGRANLAMEVAEQALADATRRRDVRAVGRLHAVLANAAEALNDDRRALQHRAEAVSAMRTLGDRRSTADLLLACQHPAAGPRRAATDRNALQLALELKAEIEVSATPSSPPGG